MANVVTGSLTRKIGPLPAWGWGAIIGGAGLGWKLLRGKGRPEEAAVPNTQLIPTGPMQIDPSAGFMNELSVALKRIEDKIGLGGGSIPELPSYSFEDGLDKALSAWEASQSQLAPLPSSVPSEGGLPYLVVRLRRALGFDPGAPTGPNPAGANTANETPEQRHARLLQEYERLSSLFATTHPIPISAKPATA